MVPAIRFVIDNHIETRMPVVMDGDYILPEMIKPYADRVQSIFLFDDHEQIIAGFEDPAKTALEPENIGIVVEL